MTMTMTMVVVDEMLTMIKKVGDQIDGSTIDKCFRFLPMQILQCVLCTKYREYGEYRDDNDKRAVFHVLVIFV